MNKFLVFQSDFGLVDGAVSAMYGVAYEVDPTLNIQNLTHEITQYNIFEASYRLFQTISYWPAGTVFVSVVDPGVGSHRKSVVAKMKNGQYIVTPDNGTLTHVAKSVGIEEMREISEKTNRLKDSEQSYTFHGRDVYAYTGARLASGVIDFEGVGPLLNVEDVVKLPTFDSIFTDNSVTGQVDILDVRFGSLWTSVSREDFAKLNIHYGQKVKVEIFHEHLMVFSSELPYVTSFSEVSIGAPLVYMNSVYCMGIAINQGSFSKAYSVGVGNSWTVKFTKVEG
ncbi:MAG: S-adenosyl-l-methionine hydroxide adenosyltransferase family protein [Erysipelotrichaceae bacterium]|nr:S-adenosyl-l-methionine hydroxide adenosyltransferase family protein [Erysipelotrichaceae bacterium]